MVTEIILLAATLLLGGSAWFEASQAPTGASVQDLAPGIYVQDPELEQRLKRLREASRTLDAEMRAVAGAPVALEVMTYEQAERRYPYEHRLLVRHGTVAYTAWLQYRGTIPRMLVVINKHIVAQQEDPLRIPTYTKEIDRILIHEIYGHSLPVIQAGGPQGICADPKARGASAFESSCVGARENRLLRELGRPITRSYF